MPESVWKNEVRKVKVSEEGEQELVDIEGTRACLCVYW